jgi:hypothetical protein
MQLISYMKTDTNKRLHISKSHGDSNRCTPCMEKPDQHDTHASHANLRTSGVHFLRVVPIHGNISWVTNRVGQSHCSREKGLLIQSTAYRLTDLRVRIQFLSRANQWSSEERQTSVDNRLLGLSGQYVQYLLTGANTSVLNRYKWGLQP